VCVLPQVPDEFQILVLLLHLGRLAFQVTQPPILFVML
jgi:hypothetical protein